MFIRMIFDGIVGTFGRVVAVFPWPVRQIEAANRWNDFLAEYRVPCFIIGVPDGDAGMVPVVPHPFFVFLNHLLGVKMHLILRAVPGVAGPNKIFILNQQTGLVGDVEPLIGHWTDAEAKTVPVHLVRDFDEKFPDPCLIPWQCAG